MKCIGFSDKTLKWFHSHFTHRAFSVSLDNKFSEVGTINCGVPQESILGPLLVSLYINDIPQALTDSHTSNSIFYQHKDVAEIENVLTKEFANVCECLYCQFILVKIKLNGFFSVRRKTCRGLT